MPGIGLVIPEITCEMLEFVRKPNQFRPVKPMLSVVSVNTGHDRRQVRTYRNVFKKSKYEY